jgi:catechol 2,3-dioxygenase-like lactoylglutathione lyase family enzyme
VDVLRSNHIGFTVRTLDPAIAMFVNLFGYVLESIGGRNPRGVARLTGVEGADIMVAHLHRAGFVSIELITYLAPADRGDAAGRPCDSGYTHLTFDVADVAAFVTRAASYGLVPVGEIVGGRTEPLTSLRVVYLRDPNGINIELIQPGR